ncbi:BppU family phage baseplate upper protein [Staphylococcus haemolyticus]|uniref:BppU family phage baseplate upper protein n=1 Tax=Staphylococcus haemolyticus TaxID=1283 RepID=UPI0034D67FB0
MIYKNKDIETNINERGINLGNVDVTLYTMDKATASIRIYLKKEVKYDNETTLEPVDLYTSKMTPRLDIVAEDGSIFQYEKIDIINPEIGLISYPVSNRVLRHIGQMNVYVYLENQDTKESVEVCSFYFDVKNDGVTGAIGKEIDVPTLETYVANVMSKNAMGLLSDDYRKRLETEIKKYIIDNNKAFNLKFEDLTRSEKDELMKNLTNQGLTDFRIEDNSISNEKLVDGTISPNKTTFFDIKKSTNLLNANRITFGKNIDSNGNIVSDENRWISEYIPMDSNEYISYTNGTHGLALYDENMNFISRVGIGNSPYSAPNVSNLKYIRIISSNDSSELMFNKGKILMPYEKPFGDVANLKPEYISNVTPEKTTFISKVASNNLVNPHTIQFDKNVDSNGDIVDKPNYWMSDFIPLKVNEQINYTKGVNAMAMFDENKKFISRVGVAGTSYSNKYAKNLNYIRFLSNTPVGQMMINKGDALLPHEEYQDDKVLNSDIKIGLDNLLNYKKSKNIFNKNTVTFNKTLDNNGAMTDDADWLVSNKIKAENKPVSFSTENSVKWAVFDKNDVLLARSGKNANETTTLNLDSIANADYFIISIVKTAKDNFMMNYGTLVLPYEDFGYTLVSSEKYPIKISSDIVPKTAGGTNNSPSNGQATVNNLVDSKQIYKEDITSYTNGSSNELYNTTNKSQIDYIEIGANDLNLELEIAYVDDNDNYQIASIVNPQDSSKMPLSIENIISYGYPNTDFLDYNPAKKQYKVAIKNLNFSNGFKVTVKNNSELTINSSIKIVGRYYV